MSPSAIIQVDDWFPHAPEAVWKALTDPALHARWWAAGDVRPVVGHRFELDMGKWGDMDSPLGKMAFDGMKEGWPKVLANIATVL